jgi:glycosyltransferase involved in cell wall biosynthesis
MTAAGPRWRICHIITMLELGGAQRNTLYTVAHLDRGRFAPSLIAGKGGQLDGEASGLQDVDVQFAASLVREIRPVSDARALVELARLLRRGAPDVVHTHSSKAGVLGRWAAHLAGVPVIIHSIHGFGFGAGAGRIGRSVLVAAERAASPITTHFIAVSQANAELGRRLGLFTKDRVSVIRSGIELGRFMDPHAAPGRLRREIGAGPDDPIAGMIACFKPQKAPEDFIAAAAIAARRLPGARFVLVGDGELRPRVEEEIRRHGLGGRVHLLGWRHDIPGILRDLDVLVLTSRWEGLPRVLPEAMACGVPVVATRVDGSPEAVRDGASGFLCEPGDIDGIASRMAGLLADRTKARQMGLTGQGLVGEWDIDEMVRRQEALYTRLLEERDVPPSLTGPEAGPDIRPMER